MQKTLDYFGAGLPVPDTAFIGKPIPEVVKAMKPLAVADFSSLYSNVKTELLELTNAWGFEAIPTSGATHALQVALLKFFDVRGKVVLTTDREYDGIVGTLEDAGATAEIEPCGKGFRERFKAAMKEWRPTAVLVSHVTRYGDVVPVNEVCSDARELGITVIVDGAQALGRVRVNLHEMKPDAYLVSGHKALRGPEGTGALFVRKEILSGRQPSVRETFNKELLSGFLEALRACKEMEAEGRLNLLHNALLEGIRSVPGARIGGSGAGIVCFAVDGVEASRLHEALRATGIVCTEVSGENVRVSLDAYSSAMEAEAIIGAVAKAAEKLR